jgi:hypothetical protein
MPLCCCQSLLRQLEFVSTALQVVAVLMSCKTLSPLLSVFLKKDCYEIGMPAWPQRVRVDP